MVASVAASNKEDGPDLAALHRRIRELEVQAISILYVHSALIRVDNFTDVDAET